MKRTFFSFILALGTLLATAQVPEAYKSDYATLAGKSGVTLFDAITTISSKGYKSHSYNDLWTYFRTTDALPNGKVWDTYSDCEFTFGSDQCGTYSSVCDCYNREHSLPKSWFGGSDSNAPGTDLFHLMPTDGKVNGQRSNYPFGECSGGTYLSSHAKGKLGTSTFSGYTNVGTVFEPDDLYKGDFARNYFGMLLRYGKSFALNQKDGGQKMFSNTGCNISSSNNYGLTDYSVALLMKWHRLDPVSDKETDRNDGIQQTQGNRNPFIDCPVLAEYFWGTKAGQSVDLQDLIDCGCANGSTTEVEEMPAFPSLTMTTMADGVIFTCLPQDASVSVFTAAGNLVSIEQPGAPEWRMSLSKGFYLLVVASGSEKQPFKVLIK